MYRRMTLRRSLPMLLVGLVMLGACAFGVRAINQLQDNLTGILTRNVASLRAAQDLEIKLRQLRFHSLTYIADPSPERARLIRADHAGFEDALGRARAVAVTDRERELIADIAAGYTGYRKELEIDPRPRLKRPEDLIHWADTHPVRNLVAPCQELLEVNRAEMEHTAEESEDVSRQARTITLGLAILGPIGGLLGGFGIARTLSRSIAWLNVWVRDVHSRLDRQAGSIRLTTEGDLDQLDEQVHQVVDRVQDMVERFQRQQQQILRAEQLAAVGQLAAGMAHEIRNPLTTIKLLIGVALRSAARPDLRLDDLRVIHGEIERLEQTVQGLLDFARLPEANRQVCDLTVLVNHALELVRTRAAQQGVVVKFKTPPVPVTLAADRNQLHTVVTNLLFNALDAMPNGGKLEVQLRDEEGVVELTVHDTGEGIAPAMAERLFTPFATSKATGTGLGLSLCRRIVEGHGGKIDACNDSRGGACFTVHLPRGAAPDSESQATRGGVVHANPAGH